MQRAQATVVAVVAEQPDADQAQRAVERLAAARNVHALADPTDAEHATRAATTLADAVRAGGTYVLTAFDPLAPLAAAWTARFDGTGTRGEFEVALDRVIGLWRGGGLELPDYYLALQPDDWTPTRRHWFLGVLHEAAPHRVVPVGSRPDPVELTGLRAGRWWPPLDRLLRDVERHVPDRVPAQGPRGAGLIDPAGRAHPPASELLSGDAPAMTLTDDELDRLSGQEPPADRGGDGHDRDDTDRDDDHESNGDDRGPDR